jgi:RDD family
MPADGRLSSGAALTAQPPSQAIRGITVGILLIPFRRVVLNAGRVGRRACVSGHPLDRYPFPVAYPARLLSIATDPADRLDKAQHLVELTATTLGVLALGWCRAHSLSPGGVAHWEKKLDPYGITLGTWIGAVQSAAKAMDRWPHDPVARAVRLAARAALPGLENFNPIRNVYAHGGKPRLLTDQEAAVSALDPGVSAILDGIEPLTGIQLGLIRRCRPGGPSFLADIDVLTGPAEPFPSRRIPCQIPYDQGIVVAYHEGSLEFAVDLTPFCVWRSCPACGRDELFYLHQRKKEKDLYFSFSTGHERISKTGTAGPAPEPAAALGLPPLGSARAAAVSQWRANWANLASRRRRLAARAIDVALMATAAAVGCLAAHLAGMPLLESAAWVAGPLAVLYEPLTALTGGTPGKRLLRIEPVSVWDSRKLGRPDVLRRALTINAQFFFPPLAVRNLAWLLWDPARQCMHDRVAASIVIAGRSRPGRKI